MASAGLTSTFTVRYEIPPAPLLPDAKSGLCASSAHCLGGPRQPTPPTSPRTRTQPKASPNPVLSTPCRQPRCKHCRHQFGLGGTTCHELLRGTPWLPSVPSYRDRPSARRSGRSPEAGPAGVQINRERHTLTVEAELGQHSKSLSKYRPNLLGCLQHPAVGFAIPLQSSVVAYCMSALSSAT